MTTNPAPLIAVTPGEPAGIGPDICLQLAQDYIKSDNPAFPSAIPVFIADLKLLLKRAELLDINIPIKPFKEFSPEQERAMWVVPLSLGKSVQCGVPDTANAAYVLACLDEAVSACLNNTFQALVTGPIQKSIINEAGIAFSGHTEYLAEHCNRDTVVMMLASRTLKVALATTHLPLNKVSAAITKAHLERIIRILHHDLEQKFALENPAILVCGLNPHAGESGHLGSEEIDIIEPVLTMLKAEGLNLHGPLPADTLFTPKYLETADAVLAMYHDQGLPVLKAQGFGEAVNITLGLPIIRTSVDHGTALDLAGTGKASSGSLLAAFSMAATMSQKQIVQ
jgi:4-hydroxythreonine-4-phosphate dehydrogenase